MLLENKRVAIVGGGPGGLTFARLLQLKDVDVKVYERDFNKEVRVQGATLDLHYEGGLKVLEVAGLTAAFKVTYRPGAGKGRIIDKQAEIVLDMHDGYEADFGDSYFRPEIDRGPLRNMLLDSLQPNTVVWDSQFKSLSKIGDVWKLEFKNGTTAIADIVIGADGGNSKVRPFITPIKPFYSGITIIQGNVPDSAMKIPGFDQLLQGGKIYTHCDEKYVHLSSKGDGSIDFYISCKMDENSRIEVSDKIQLLTWFKKEFQEWGSIWLELYENASYPLLLRPQYCIPLDQNWDAQSNLTVIGDAAHIMPPSGEGVNLAMLDALELSECLTGDGFETVQTAIAAYEKSMQARGTHEAEESLKMAEWMHAEDAQDKLVLMFSKWSK